MTTVYSFNTTKSPALSQVGGKALSLIQMTGNGLPVPPGIVCSVEFFTPWFEALKRIPEWDALMSAEKGDLGPICDAVKACCRELPFSEEQLSEIETMIEGVTTNSSDLFAIRSSSPQEDLEGASFAGAYETLLGVRPDGIQDAIREAFASALDARVFLYKEEQGFSRRNPTIAIIIQKQIASETAGVAFTLNPLNNCYDQIVINANFGLGESVVSGLVSPDLYIVDKVTGTVLEETPGKKELVIHLGEDGGTWEENTNDKKQPLCLSRKDLADMTAMLAKVEDFYQKPMDTEWAIAEGTLYLLQARPITAYIPLPDALITKPGMPKRLYLDMTLSKQGIHKALTPMGTDWLAWNQRDFMAYLFGRDITGIENGAAETLEGRSYVNGNMFRMMGIEKQIAAWGQADSMAAEILRTNDLSEYIPKKLPPQLKGAMFGVLKNSMTSIRRALKAMKKPYDYAAWYQEQEKTAMAKLDQIVGQKGGLNRFIQESMEWYIEFTNDYTLPMTYAAEFARTKIRKLFANVPEQIRELSRKLETALPHNITIEMGLEMYKLSQHQDIQDCENQQQFKAMIKNNDLSPAMTNAIKDFSKRFGFRCAMELDIATPRPAEDMSILFDQLKSMSTIKEEELNPFSMQKRGIAEREQAFNSLCEYLAAQNRSKVRKFKQAYQVLEAFGGYREIHKYYLIMILSLTRGKVLAIADQLIRQGRLEYREQIFLLKFRELEQGIADSSVNLIQKGIEGGEFYQKIRNIDSFPAVFDSRGTILRPPKRTAKPGEFTGEAISLGTVKGTIKVLNSPDEKPLHPGEILVARATDPGWTPLFINAAGVILEVGGLFQHGALVAREYGKPCVAGIENATRELKDGMEVELDGSNGIIRILSEAPSYHAEEKKEQGVRK